MMGLDVHDMEDWGEVYVGYEGRPKFTQFGLKSLRLARPHKPGFRLDIEPGSYIYPFSCNRSLGKAERATRIGSCTTRSEVRGLRRLLTDEGDFLITAKGRAGWARPSGHGRPMSKRSGPSRGHSVWNGRDRDCD